MNAIISSIFGESHSTLAVSAFSRLLGCISLPVFVAGCSPCGGDRGICGVWSALCCCCPWQSLPSCRLRLLDCWWSSLLVIVIFVGHDRFCFHLWILLLIINLFLFWSSKLVSSSSLNNLLLLCCPIDVAGSLFFQIKNKIKHLYSVRFLQLADYSACSIVEGGRVIVR